MKSPKVNIYKIQMAYFFKEESEFRAFGLISSLYARLNDVFKTEPQSLPIPDNAPLDVPRCIWSDVNTSLTFNKMRLDFTFNIPSKFSWELLLNDFNGRIMPAIEEQKILIDRVGLVAELTSEDNLDGVLREHIQIDKFNDAPEANISWLENIDSYNVWIYFTINKSEDINNIVFDINSLPECKLADQGTSGQIAMSKCAELLKRKMINVL